ncbi:BQ2448_5524 [Microbotryum intermedium]|uniref:BQ2448_5524 protein n=1 Tax=Microbotryum intermedium TaxID=269621 RepID=A0A238F7C2_9BASI|nr:BQ2448_5524 [Microbotryum intermedium]
MDANTLFQVFNASFDAGKSLSFTRTSRCLSSVLVSLQSRRGKGGERYVLLSLYPNVRISAELELRKLEPVQGLIPTLLQLIAPSSAASPVVRLAASIYLKNRVKSSWRIPAADPSTASSSTTPPTRTHYTPIPSSDRLSLKTNLLPLLTSLANDHSHGNEKVKAQVAHVLDKVVSIDYPKDWPGLGHEIQQLLATGEQARIEAGLRASVCVFSALRFNGDERNTDTLPNLAASLLPQLLALSQHIITPSPSDSTSYAAQGTLLALLIKAYKNSLSHTLTPAHQAHDSIVPWGTLLLRIVQTPLAIPLLPEDDDEREEHPWCKAKKWSFFALNRLFDRYGNPSQLPSNMKAPYLAFAQRFEAQFAPEILKTYLGVVERLVGGEWQSKKAKHFVLNYFMDCIKPKHTWALIKPHILPLVQSFVFPLVCLTDEEIEQFSEDPQDFAKAHFGDFVADSYGSPTASALNFINELVELRTAYTLRPILAFIQQVASKYPSETTPKQKDGALRMLIALASTAVKSKKIAPMMESFFTVHVLPEFKSEHGILRYRVCEVVEKYESFDMKWETRTNLDAILHALMNCITDPELPVRIQAAIALPELIRYEDVRAEMIPNVGRIIQELLKLSNEVDLDALTNTTRSIVGEFQVEVMPFAVELTQSLTGSYTRLIHESLEQRARQNPDDESLLYGDEKTLVQMNLLKTIEQLTISLEGTPMLDQIEAIVAPALQITIENDCIDLYDEVYDILDSLTFSQKKISPCLWPIFVATYNTFKAGSVEFVHEMSGFLDNCVTYGREMMTTNESYRRMVLDMYDTIMISRELGADDRCTACKLAEGILLNLQGHADEALPVLLERSMKIVLSRKTDDPDYTITNSLFLHALEVVVAAVLYNPALTLAILDGHDWSQQFFAIWFKNLPRFTRVHDKKMIVVAMCALLEWLAQGGKESALTRNISMVIVGALTVFRDLPGALVKRKALEKHYAKGGDDLDENEEDVDDFDDDDDDEEEEVEEGDLKDATNDYLEQLIARDNAGTLGGNEDEDDDDDACSNWSDEILWASPLDEIDTYVKFTTVLTTLERSVPDLFQLAVGPLDAKQKAELGVVARRALAGGEKAEVGALAGEQ